MNVIQCELNDAKTNKPLKRPFVALNTTKDKTVLQIPENKKTASVITIINKDKLTLLKPNIENKTYCILRPEDLHLKLPSTLKTTKVGRPKKVYNEKLEGELLQENNIEEVPIKVFRTRSGRLTKPPRYIEQKTAEQNSSDTTNNNSENSQKLIPENTTPFSENKQVILEKSSCNIKKDIEYKRNISSQYRCVTCKKAYLGRIKMMKHIQLNPSHVAPIFTNKVHDKTSDLWTDFTRRISSIAEDQQARLICEEFRTFVHKARNVIPKLLKIETDTKLSSCFKVDKTVSNALGIPEGCYSFIENKCVNKIINLENEDKANDHEICSKRDEKIETIQINCENNSNNHNIITENKSVQDNKYTTEFINNCENNGHRTFEDAITNSERDNCVQIQNNEQNSLLNLLDSGQVTFDTTNSDEVMNMDQLIQERLKSLTGGELETNSGAQNLHLDLSLDMFS